MSTWESATGDAACELLLDAVEADDGARREELAEELKAVRLPMAYVEDAQAFQTFQARRPDRRIVVHLQLEDVRSLADLAEDAHDYALCAEKSVPTVLAGFLVWEELEVDAVCGLGNESEDASAPDLALPGLRCELFRKRGANLLQASRPQEESHGYRQCKKERDSDHANGHPDGARHCREGEDYPEKADYQANQNGVEDQIQGKLDPKERDASPDENTRPEQAQHAF